LLITSVLVLPLWIFIANRLSKQIAYMAGMIFWAIVQLVIFVIRPGQVTLVLAMSLLAGISVSSAHLLPDSIFPDVIEWDELRTRRRSEGLYYGVKNFIRKLTGALAIFIGLQVLGWFGYRNPPADVTRFVQPDSALFGIRMLIGPLGAVLLLSAVLMAWFYPLTRERHARIRRLLEQRKSKSGTG
jgi:GPH family glycoside/pentoside/hexuronide:cation symporter